MPACDLAPPRPGPTPSGPAQARPTLLGPADPAPVLAIRREGPGPWVFALDHAGAFVPQALDGLGLGREALDDHIGIDIGIFAVVSWLSALLDAPLVAQPFSRLVIDCNRVPGVASSIAEVSDARPVPGNAGLTPEDRAAREAEIFAPYHARLAAVMAEAAHRLGHPPVLMAMHSFTRAMRGGARRTVDIGVIHEGPNPLADALIPRLAESGLNVQRNAPYRVGMDTDQTVPQAIAAGYPHLEIEICQDLIATCAGQRRLAEIFWRALSALAHVPAHVPAPVPAAEGEDA